MLIGLDVGGTNTDAALLEAHSGRCLASAKAPTRPGDVLPGLLEALEKVLPKDDPGRVRRVSVSSTLGLNALITGMTEPTGVVAVPGPGLDPRLFWPDDPLLHVLSGSVDHRGRVTAPLDPAEVDAVVNACGEQGARALAVVCKFSPKNPELEQNLARRAEELLGAIPIVQGSDLSGRLNFPRRLHTAWCNAALSRLNRDFIAALQTALRGFGLSCPLVVLKADAGVFPATEAALDPAGSMGSGPAASLLGVWALARNAHEDLLMVDMGGTSTDLALLARGQPLLSRRGLTVNGRPTLIRSLLTHSIALGGDSCLRVLDGALQIGPDRAGPALALDSSLLDTSAESGGGVPHPPTLTDALNIVGLADVGDKRISLRAMMELAKSPLSPESSAVELARRFADTALARVHEEATALLEQVNAEPVYTIRELLVNEPIKPSQAVLIGGPAAGLASAAEKAFGMPVTVPSVSACANAVGAALARHTFGAELYADTQLGWMRIPDFGVQKKISAGYSLKEARDDMRAAFERKEHETGTEADGEGDMQVVYEESFAMLDGQGRRGRIIRMRAQRAAGLLVHPDPDSGDASSHSMSREEKTASDKTSATGVDA